MIALFESSFLKDIKKVDNAEIANKLQNIIKQIKSSESIKDIFHLRKLKSYKSYYRIRVGDYRLGLKIESNTVVIIRFLHRKDIYKVFP